jgi:cytoskeleton protein RodZ
MSEETPAPLTEAITEAPKVRPALGTSLRNARENLKLEIDDVAQQLRMSAHQVTALEQDNHAALPAATFVRGFIRNYARLLRIDAAPLLNAYHQMQPDSQLHNSISLKLESIPITNNAQKSFRLYLLTSFLLIVLGSGWWLYMEWSDKQVKNHNAHVAVTLPEAADKQQGASTAPNTENTAIPAPEAGTPIAMPAAETPAATQKPAVPISQATPPMAPAAAPSVAPVSTPPAAQKAPAPSPVPVVTAPAPPVITTPTPAPTSANLTGSIRMIFSEQTWVSVTDTTGKEVFNKNKAADSEDSADGKPPFTVVIGNAAGMQMFYKDQPVDIVSHTKSNVARFTLPQP